MSTPDGPTPQISLRNAGVLMDVLQPVVARYPTVNNDNACEDQKMYMGQKCGNHLVYFP